MSFHRIFLTIFYKPKFLSLHHELNTPKQFRNVQGKLQLSIKFFLLCIDLAEAQLNIIKLKQNKIFILLLLKH